MGIFNWIGGLFFSSASIGFGSDHTDTNPATGLPMVESGMGGVDVAGNPYGNDPHRRDDERTPSPLLGNRSGPSPSD